MCGYPVLNEARWLSATGGWSGMRSTMDSEIRSEVVCVDGNPVPPFYQTSIFFADRTREGESLWHPVQRNRQIPLRSGKTGNNFRYKESNIQLNHRESQ